MKVRVLPHMIWVLLCSCLLLTVARGGYRVRYDVLSGASDDESRHDSLLNTALLVNSLSEHNGIQTVFPSLQFNCSGVIHKLYLLGRVGSGSAAPTFTLWKEGAAIDRPQFNNSVPLVNLRTVLHNSETGIALYEHIIERDFVSGDMIGFMQPSDDDSSVVLQYQTRNGDSILFNDLPPHDTDPWTQMSYPQSAFPLVAIETSNAECTSGFLSRQALERVVDNHLAISGSLDPTHPELELRLFPDIKFTCSATITRLTVAVDISTGGLSAVPEIQVWRSMEGKYSRVASAQLSVALLQEVPLQPGVYNIETSLPFMEGDILGILYPTRSNVLLFSLAGHGSPAYIRPIALDEDLPLMFQEDSSLLNATKQWPMVAVDSGASSCIQGFMSHTLLTLLALKKKSLTHIPRALTLVAPDLTFTTDGLLQKWMFVSEDDSSIWTGYPHFQVWRRTERGFTAVNGTATHSYTPVRSGELNVYEYTLDPPAQVQSGDFVSWVHPSSTKRWLPLVVNNTGYEIHLATSKSNDVIFGTEVLEYHSNPLIGVQMLVEEATPATTTTTVVVSTDIPDPTPEDDSSGGFPQLLGTILGSGLMGLVIILGLVLMLFFVLWAIQKHRKTREKTSTAVISTERNLSNPLYAQEPNGHMYQTVQNTKHQPPTIPLTVIQQGSVEYDEPIVPTGKKAPPPVSPKPTGRNSQPPPSPTSTPKYHTLERQGASPKYHTLEREGASPKYHTLERQGASPKYHTLERQGASPLLSPQVPSHSSPHFPYVLPHRSVSSDGLASSLGQRSPNSPLPLSPFASLECRGISHSRDPSNTSEYDIIQPPRWDTTGNTLRTTSKGSSHTGGHSRSPSLATTCDDEQHSEHLYQELTPEERYSRLYRQGMCVPNEELRQRAATTAHRQRINIYAALSECGEQPDSVAFFEESDAYWRPARDSTGLYAQLAQRKYREIIRHQITVQHPLGSGQFGVVNKGEWQSVKGPMEVAVKTLKRGSSEEDTVRFLQEAAIMGQFRHPNIAQLLGVVTLSEPVLIVLELLSLGDLRSHLLSLRPLTPGDTLPEKIPSKLLGFCKDIASGMEYLERKLFVHRDLAARNILVADDNTCKIGDFGMARDLENENYYISRGGKIPIKWSPPEALNFKKYTTASDVWSYGIVMYEIWSLGHKPYEGYTNPQTQRLVERGERLAPPPGCPRAIYTLMIYCWHPEHASRPTFLSLLKTLCGASGELLGSREGGTCELPAQAMTLGAPLEAGRNLYPELQRSYCH